jgi:GNAT superfamily N-acetyltransferase
VITISAATRADLPAVADVLARAFHDDPEFLWALPDPADRPRRLRRIFGTVLRYEALRHGGVEVARADDRVVGAALWLPPDHWREPALRQLLAAPGYLRGFGRRIGYGSTLVDACAEVHPREPHWYLYVLGVDPALQGKGVGAALLRSRLERCDRDRLPAYLESSKLSNVPLYEHFGFAKTGVVDLPPGAPELTTMWRPPR